MRAGESRTVIKRMQEFMDNLDRHVLNQKVLGNVKVKHLAAAFLAYKALQGMGKVENAETAGQIYAGGLQAIASMGGAFGMIGEKHFDGPENSDRTALNTMIVSATHFMVAQAENGEKLYDKDGRYTGTVVNRYDRDGKIIDSVPVYQVKEAAKSQMRKVAKNVQNMFMNTAMRHVRITIMITLMEIMIILILTTTCIPILIAIFMIFTRSSTA